MNKEIYISELSRELDKLNTPVSTREKIIDYYQQYFDDAFDFGKSFEEIYQELGSPESLSKDITSGIQLKAQDIFTSEEALRIIEVALIDIRIHLVFSENPGVSVTYQGSEEYIEDLMNTSYRSGHLRIAQRIPRPVVLNAIKKGEKPYLLIELNASFKGKMMIKTTDGRIIVDGKKQSTKIQCHLYTQEARIECHDLKCKTIQATSENGRIKISRCNCQNLNLESRHGRMDLDLVSSQMALVKNYDNRILVTRCHIDYAECINESGRIDIVDSIIDDCHMETEDGRIHYALVECNEGLHLDLLSRDGKVFLNGDKLNKGSLLIKDVRPRKKEKNYFNIYARSSTGRIEIVH